MLFKIDVQILHTLAMWAECWTPTPQKIEKILDYFEINTQTTKYRCYTVYVCIKNFLLETFRILTK